MKTHGKPSSEGQTPTSRGERKPPNKPTSFAYPQKKLQAKKEKNRTKQSPTANLVLTIFTTATNKPKTTTTPKLHVQKIKVERAKTIMQQICVKSHIKSHNQAR